MFPLEPWFLHLYQRKLLQILAKIYNYLHLRAKIVIENAFGILRARRRIFNHPIKVSGQNTERYVIACLRLHNYLLPSRKSLVRNSRLS